MEAIVPWVLEALQWENRPPRSALVAIHNWRGARVPEGDVGTVVVGPLLHLMGTRNPLLPLATTKSASIAKRAAIQLGPLIVKVRLRRRTLDDGAPLVPTMDAVKKVCDV